MTILLEFECNLSVQISAGGLDVTLLVGDQLTAYVPLYSNKLHPYTSALFVELSEAEVSVNLIHGIGANADFKKFRIMFLEDFEQVRISRIT